MHWGNNHSAVEVILLEAKSPDRQIYIYISQALSVKRIFEAAVEISKLERWIKWLLRKKEATFSYNSSLKQEMCVIICGKKKWTYTQYSH